MMPLTDILIADAKGGYRLNVKLNPGARRNAVDGVEVWPADGGYRLKVSVTVAPEKGKANAALVKLLAKEWRLPKSAFSFISGELSREKYLHIEADYAWLQAIPIGTADD